MASPRDHQAPVRARGGFAERELVNGGDESTDPRSSRRPPPSGMGVGETVAFVVGLIAIIVIVALL
jgi:hypothetical protein